MAPRPRLPLPADRSDAAGPATPAARPDELGKLLEPRVDTTDAKQDLAKRAKSWLHVNCSSCHVEAGGGNAQMELEFATKLAGASGAKGSVDPAVAEQLLGKIDEIAKIFWETKQA